MLAQRLCLSDHYCDTIEILTYEPHSGNVKLSQYPLEVFDLNRSIHPHSSTILTNEFMDRRRQLLGFHSGAAISQHANILLILQPSARATSLALCELLLLTVPWLPHSDQASKRARSITGLLGLGRSVIASYTS